MQPITITRYGTGKCILRGIETEGVEVEFRDCNLKGFIGWAEFKKLLKARSEEAPAKNSTHNEIAKM